MPFMVIDKDYSFGCPIGVDRKSQKENFLLVLPYTVGTPAANLWDRLERMPLKERKAQAELLLLAYAEGK